MEELYLGIELDDEGCGLAWFHPEKKTVQKLQDAQGMFEIPAFMCLNTEENRWYAGEEAKSFQGKDGCIVLNRLLSLFRSGQQLEVEDACYTGEMILQEFLHAVLQEAIGRSGLSEIGSLVICLETAEVRDAEGISRICSHLGLASETVHILGKQECFMYYLMSQRYELWSNVSFLFDYSKKGLACYEMSLLKGIRPVTAQTRREWIEGAPLLEQMRQSEEAREAADRWFASLAEKKMSGKIVSSVMLCGEGFAEVSWARQFLKGISSQKSRKVYQAEALFEMGAAFAAYHAAKKQKEFPYRCICEGRIQATISIFVEEHSGSEQLILAQAGTNCYEARTSIDLNLIGQTRLNLFVRDIGATESYKLPLDLSGFMEDGRERTKIRLSIAFLKSDIMVVRIQDMGFGEIYLSTGKVIEQHYNV